MFKNEGATMKASLTFDTLRAGNTTRLPLFKNQHGGSAHAEPDGSDWTLSEWVNAAVGEHGEMTELFLIAAITKSFGLVTNMAKKIRRGDHTLDVLRPLIAKEIGDIVAYCDLLAFRAGIDLGEAVMLKFNEVSQRIGCDVLIDEYGVYRAKLTTVRAPEHKMDYGAFGGELDEYSLGARHEHKSIAPQSTKCDGDHGGPACDDAECWHRDPAEVEKLKGAV